MCGKLPHVETLSNPDNYSLFSVALLDLRSILLTAETVGFFTRKIPVAADDALQAADGAPRSLASYSRTRLSWFIKVGKRK